MSDSGVLRVLLARVRCARASLGSAQRFRSALQLITLRYTIDRPSRAGTAVAMARACGAIPACHDRVCVILACHAVWRGTGAGNDLHELQSLYKSLGG